VDKIERNLETALKNLEELNSKVDKLANEVSELRKLQNPKVLKGDSSTGTKNSNALTSKSTLEENPAHLSSTATSLGFIPQNTKMKDVGPKAKFFLCTLLAQASRKMIAYYNRELKQLGISAQQMIALGVLAFQDEVTLGKFAEGMKISRPTALHMLNRLKGMELITAEPHPSDGRLKVYKITEKTSKLIPEIRQKVKEVEGFIESQAVSSSLDRLVIDLSMLLRLKF
jgi:DNA-binding MarR family transcriptional regulator